MPTVYWPVTCCASVTRTVSRACCTALTRLPVRWAVRCIHLPLPYLLEYPQAAQGFETVGVSVHSTDEAKEAIRLGATYLTAGHVFLTDCKKGVPARGLDFLRAVCDAVPVPVYAIGGITPQNAPDCLAAGASGVAVMSGVMNRLSDWNI